MKTARTVASLAAATLSLLVGGAAVPTAAQAAPSSYTFLSGGQTDPARWDPCTTITYRTDLRQAPSGAAADLTTAVARVASATGLTFKNLGSTTVTPGFDAEYPADTKVVISWKRPGESDWLPAPPPGYSTAAGNGGASWTTGYRADGSRAQRMLTGHVVMNSTSRLEGGFTANGRSRGLILQHEVAHMIGLGHTDDRTQLMHPVLQVGVGGFGDGDRNGLRLLGRSQGCLYAQDPRSTPTDPEPTDPEPSEPAPTAPRTYCRTSVTAPAETTLLRHRLCG